MDGVPLSGTAFLTVGSLPNTLPWRRQQRTSADGGIVRCSNCAYHAPMLRWSDHRRRGTMHAQTVAEPRKGGRRFALWHNRDYLLLWSRQTVSVVCTQGSGIAVPLLILAITQSP